MKLVTQHTPVAGSISLIIPTFNRDDQVEQLLESLSDRANKEADKSLEIIVVDDNGRRPEQISFWSKLSQIPGVKVLPLPDNYGAGMARNAAMQLARNEWIAFLDDDDDVDIERLLVLAELFSHTEYDVVVHSLDSQKGYRCHQKILKNYLYFYDNQEAWRFLIRRSYQFDFGLRFSEGTHQDIVFSCYMLAVARKVKLVSEDLHSRNRRLPSETSCMNTDRVCGYVNAIKNLLRNWDTLSGPLPNEPPSRSRMIVQCIGVTLYQIAVKSPEHSSRVKLLECLRSAIDDEYQILEALCDSANNSNISNFEKSVQEFVGCYGPNGRYDPKQLDLSLRTIFSG